MGGGGVKTFKKEVTSFVNGPFLKNSSKIKIKPGALGNNFGYRRCTMKKLNCTFCYSDFISETKQGLKIKIKIQYLKKFIYSTSVSRSRLAASAFSSCSIRAEINEHLADWHWHGIGWVLVAGSKTSTCIAYCLSFFLLPSSTLLKETSQPMISSTSTSSSPPVLPNYIKIKWNRGPG